MMGITTEITYGQTEKQQSKSLENKNGQKNNCMDISRDKLRKLCMKWYGNG